MREQTYTDLEKLRCHYGKYGLKVLAFPTNSLMQNRVSPAQIKHFNEVNGGANFTLFGKIKVNGANTHPLYVFLKKKFGGSFFNNIKWNYMRFLVSREGIPVRR